MCNIDNRPRCTHHYEELGSELFEEGEVKFYLSKKPVHQRCFYQFLRGDQIG